jgi:hypothetical protein
MRAMKRWVFSNRPGESLLGLMPFQKVAYRVRSFLRPSRQGSSSVDRFAPWPGHISMPAVISCCLFILTACGQAPSSDQPTVRSTTTTAPPLPGGYGLVAPDPSLTDRMTLSPTRVSSGHSVDGTLVVVNHGTVPVNLTHVCRPDFEVALTNSNYVPQVAWAADCLARPFIIVPGVNRLPFQVTTMYLACAQSGLSPNDPACLPTGSPPLPVGNYVAVLVGNGLALPEPRPISVTLTAPTG